MTPGEFIDELARHLDGRLIVEYEKKGGYVFVGFEPSGTFVDPDWPLLKFPINDLLGQPGSPSADFFVFEAVSCLATRVYGTVTGSVLGTFRVNGKLPNKP